MKRSDQMNRAALLVGLAAMGGCADVVRTYDVELDRESICRTFGSQPEACAEATTPGQVIRVTIEDRWDGTALIHGRADSSAKRTYQAIVPRPGRYEVLESSRQENQQTGCINTTQLILVLNVDDKGMDGGEETRNEENRRCNDFNERRVTVRTREWRGSRQDG
jgi:hypothetical protein